MNYEKWKTKVKVLSHWVDEGCCCEDSQVTEELMKQKNRNGHTRNENNEEVFVRHDVKKKKSNFDISSLK